LAFWDEKKQQKENRKIRQRHKFLAEKIAGGGFQKKNPSLENVLCVCLCNWNRFGFGFFYLSKAKPGCSEKCSSAKSYVIILMIKDGKTKEAAIY
jgi:hypothetical protein